MLFLVSGAVLCLGFIGLVTGVSLDLLDFALACGGLAWF